ncbi:LamB/YcsF family protein [Mucilaginibacter limnophilus]|uniref:5-oxoprolinase subunit A n=1 Tax=Mucilaginibacter limnophilus TaxID=1932778 RepID=A0A3S2Y0I7_9SPHI|nr:5-oxoprolinase subunit PxpA [Mucilaginibacter limnophilus]RVT96494.1 LamB/YcsF family protein [Mucilaginibacter limnophilus]
MQSIDLNCDLGEGFENDSLLMNYITSANIACGFHAGSAKTMQQTVAMAVKKGVAIGAHPGLPDLQNFGRKQMQISPADAYQMTLYQIGALYGFVKAAGARLHHVKLHGALYNMAAKSSGLAMATAEAVRDFDPSLILYGLAGSEMIKAAESIRLKTASEVFADRSYQDDGTLTPRSQTNALITLENEMTAQVLLMIKHGQVKSVNQNIIPIKAETLCLHGDGEHAVAFARMIHEELQKEDIVIKVV